MRECRQASVHEASPVHPYGVLLRSVAHGRDGQQPLRRALSEGRDQILIGIPVRGPGQPALGVESELHGPSLESEPY